MKPIPSMAKAGARISLVGQNVLYEVDDKAQIVRILAVVGQRQNPRQIR